MSDKFMQSFWANTSEPWNTLGPELAKNMLEGASRKFDGESVVGMARTLREARRKLRLTQYQVADAVGMSRNSVGEFERAVPGKGAVGWAVLAKYYGIECGPAVLPAGPNPNRDGKDDPDQGC